MPEYLQNMPEEKKDIVIGKCYEDVLEVYNTVSEISSHWRLPVSTQNKPKNSGNAITWEDFVSAMNVTKNMHEQIENRPEPEPFEAYTLRTLDLDKYHEKLLEKYLGSVSKLQKETTMKKEEIQRIRDIALYGSILSSFRAYNPDAFRIDRAVNIRGDGQMHGKLVENNEDGRKFFSAIREVVSNSYSAKDLQKSINTCTDLKNIGKVIFDEFEEQTRDYIEGIFRTVLSDDNIKRKKQNVKKELNKIERRIKHIAKKQPYPEIKQSDTVAEKYKSTFSKLLTTTPQDIKDRTKVDFLRNIAKQFVSLDKDTYIRMNELTGIEHNILFHIIGDERELQESEKQAFSSITGEQFI